MPYDKENENRYEYDDGDEFNLERYIRDEEEPENELLDYTTSFLETLRKHSDKDGFGAIIWIIGTTGSGKSALMCELDDILLKHSFPKRNVAFYQAPENLLREVKKAVPSVLRDKFRIIDKLTEVNKFDILNVDEGILSADAKNALTKDSTNFIASLTTLRHNSVIIILNSLDNGILRGYRLKAQFRFYKLLTEGYMDEVNDKFAKRHRNNITNLFPEQTIFSISHIDFLKAKIRKGALTLPIKKYCTWYNEKISRSFEGEDFDARMRRLVKKKLSFEEVIVLLIRKFGGSLSIKLARGFLLDQYLETFRQFEMDLKDIVDIAQFRMFERRQEQEQEVQEEVIEQTNDSNLVIYDGLFSNDFSYTDDQIFDLIRKNEKWRNIERNISIFQERQKGKYLQEIAVKYNRSYNRVSEIIKEVQGAVNRWKGDLLENFVKKKLNQSGLFGKVIKEGGKGEADILAYSKDDKKLTIYSIKNIKIDRKPYWLVVDELRPELTRAKLQKKDYKVKLILLIYNNLTKQIKQYQIDYNNPVNIDISR